MPTGAVYGWTLPEVSVQVRPAPPAGDAGAPVAAWSDSPSCCLIKVGQVSGTAAASGVANMLTDQVVHSVASYPQVVRIPQYSSFHATDIVGGASGAAVRPVLGADDLRYYVARTDAAAEAAAGVGAVAPAPARDITFVYETETKSRSEAEEAVARSFVGHASVPSDELEALFAGFACDGKTEFRVARVADVAHLRASFVAGKIAGLGDLSRAHPLLNGATDYDVREAEVRLVYDDGAQVVTRTFRAACLCAAAAPAGTVDFGPSPGPEPAPPVLPRPGGGLTSVAASDDSTDAGGATGSDNDAAEGWVTTPHDDGSGSGSGGDGGAYDAMPAPRLPPASSRHRGVSVTATMPRPTSPGGYGGGTAKRSSTGTTALGGPSPPRPTSISRLWFGDPRITVWREGGPVGPLRPRRNVKLSHRPPFAVSRGGGDTCGRAARSAGRRSMNAAR